MRPLLEEERELSYLITKHGVCLVAGPEPSSPHLYSAKQAPCPSLPLVHY